MSFLNKTYSFVKQENMDAFLKAIGIPEDKIENLLKFAPDQKLTKDGDTYTYFTTTSEGGPREVKFKSGIEFDDVAGVDKTPIKSTYVVDGNTVTQTVISPLGNGTFKREFNGDDLVITLSVDKWDGVAKRYYKAK